MKNCCEREGEHLAFVKRAKEGMPSEEEIVRVGLFFKAISEPSRLKILLALRMGEACVYHIVQAVGGTQSAVSHQLRILRDSRMIKSRREGQNILYSLADEHVVKLLETAVIHDGCEV